MLISIDKIVVNNRIRKDYGDLEELADDIRANTLLNPPVVAPNDDGTYTLIAGERRLRAMRDVLGYKQVTVNTVSVRDDEHALLMEISENECRKEFTKTERLDYARRLARIEAAKAKERMVDAHTVGVENSPQLGKTRDKVAETLGTSSNTIAREQFIEDNRDMVSVEDFAAWDEGKLSTNRVFQQIKAAKAQAERERDMAKEDLAEAWQAQENAETEATMLKRKLESIEQTEPQVIEREVEVVREVESEESRHRIRELEHLERIHQEDNQKLRERNEKMRKELDRARSILSLDETTREVQRDVQYLVTSTNQYVRHYGGLTWTVQSLSEVDDQTLEELRKAVRNLVTFANTLMSCLEEING